MHARCAHTHMRLRGGMINPLFPRLCKGRHHHHRRGAFASRQLPDHLYGQPFSRCPVEITDNGKHCITCDVILLVECLELLKLQRTDAVHSTAGAWPIRMIAIGRLEKSVFRNRGRRLFTALYRNLRTFALALEILLVEVRPVNHIRQQLECRRQVCAIAQTAQFYPGHVTRRTGTQLGTQRFDTLGNFICTETGSPHIQQGTGHVCQTGMAVIAHTARCKGDIDIHHR